MRLFLAFEIPAPVRSRLVERARALRDGLPEARWVKSEAMHLTLVFLGETDPQQVAVLDRELGAAFAAAPAFNLTVTGVGAFPPRGRARVVWVGVEADGDLAGVQAAAAQAVERAVGPLAGEKGRGYHPHVTLARCPQGWPRPTVDDLAARFGGDHATPFPADRAALIESRLGPGGARYTVRSTYPLGAAR